MFYTSLKKMRLEDIEAAIRRAKEYVAEQNIPLTVERLAAEMDLDLFVLNRILRGDTPGKGPGMAAKYDAIRRAAGEATASVMEHAMRRGTSPNMHMLYLKNHAGYDTDKPSKAEREEVRPPVVFMGEEDIPD